jgi:hypothetical protein
VTEIASGHLGPTGVVNADEKYTRFGSHGMILA